MDRYVGIDAHSTSCTLAVVGSSGKRLRSLVVETNGRALVDAVRSIPGRVHVCLEEGTQSGWLHEILEPHVEDVIVMMASETKGPKSDARDAWTRAEQLRVGGIQTRVFKAPPHFAFLRNAVRAHLMAVADLTRVKNRLRAVFRSRGVAVDQHVYDAKARAKWVKATADRAPAACGVARSGTRRAGSAARQSRAVAARRGKDPSHHAQAQDGTRHGTDPSGPVMIAMPTHPLHEEYQRRLRAGTKPNLAKLTLARRIAAIVLSMWKHQEVYDPKRQNGVADEP